MSGHRLSNQQLLSIFREAIEAPALEMSSAVERPRAVFLGGQPGCGKSTVARASGSEFAEEGFVHVDVDRVRHVHPDYLPLISRPETEIDAPSMVQRDCSKWVDMLVLSAADNRRNMLVDVTMRVPEQVEMASQLLRAKGYTLEAHIMAVTEKVSEV